MAIQNPAEWQTVTAIADVGLVLVVAAGVVYLARLVRQPAVIGEIVAGIVLGPSLLGLLPGNLPEHVFPDVVRPSLSVVAQIGVLLFLFVVGWEFDSRVVRDRKGATAVIWLSSMVVPLTLGVLLAFALYGPYGEVDGQRVGMVEFVIYLGVAMSITALPVLARIIAEHGLKGSPVGVLALALAAADDILAWLLLAVVVALATTAGPGTFLMVALWSAVYLAGMFWVVRPLLAALARRVGPGAKPYLTMLTAAGVFLSSYVTAQVGIHAIFGAFVFGLVMPRGARLTAQIPLEHASRLLMPVYFVVTGFSVDLTSLTGRTLLMMLAVIAVACLGKLGGVTLSARFCGMGRRDSVTLGLLMNTRGLTQLVILNVGLDLGLLNTELFSALVVMAVVTTAMAAPLLTLTTRRDQPAPDHLPVDLRKPSRPGRR